ncbi:hypothetical protein RJ55_01245 [Drechmeria coniospora]|nr:hypothetical protein RJ55_01245 [Drechmeria coniospora]
MLVGLDVTEAAEAPNIDRLVPRLPLARPVDRYENRATSWPGRQRKPRKPRWTGSMDWTESTDVRSTALSLRSRLGQPRLAAAVNQPLLLLLLVDRASRDRLTPDVDAVVTLPRPTPTLASTILHQHTLAPIILDRNVDTRVAMISHVLTTLLVAASAMAAPAAEVDADANKCTSRSTKVKEWTVGDFDFHSSYIFSTPAHQNSWGYVNFTLTHPAVNYKAQCSGQSNQLSDFFYGTTQYSCTIPGSRDQATFSFDRPTGELKLDHSWSCAGEGSHFNAKGGAKLKLACSESYYKNPAWKKGEIYSTRTVNCARVTVKAPIKEMSGVA